MNKFYTLAGLSLATTLMLTSTSVSFAQHREFEGQRNKNVQHGGEQQNLQHENHSILPSLGHQQENQSGWQEGQGYHQGQGSFNNNDQRMGNGEGRPHRDFDGDGPRMEHHGGPDGMTHREPGGDRPHMGNGEGRPHHGLDGDRPQVGQNQQGGPRGRGGQGGRRDSQGFNGGGFDGSPHERGREMGFSGPGQGGQIPSSAYGNGGISGHGGQMGQGHGGSHH